MPGFRDSALEMTTEEAIRKLFPKRIVVKADQAAADPEARTELQSFVSRHQEDRCRAYLEQLRWPECVRCPRCDASKGISRIRRRSQFECTTCGYQFSVRVGTIFHASHLPLWKWFLAVYVIGESRDGISANELKRMLAVSYKTAWFLSHRIRAAMKDETPDPMLLIDDVASHQHLSAKHLPAYLDEIAFRQNNRDNPYLLRDMLLRLIGAESLPYTELIASA